MLTVFAFLIYFGINFCAFLTQFALLLELSKEKDFGGDPIVTAFICTIISVLVIVAYFRFYRKWLRQQRLKNWLKPLIRCTSFINLLIAYQFAVVITKNRAVILCTFIAFHVFVSISTFLFTGKGQLLKGDNNTGDGSKPLKK